MLHRFMAIRRERELQEAWKRIWSTPDGRMVIADLYRRVGLLEISHRYSVEDPGGRDSAFREGQRSVALEILTFLKTEPAELADLIKQSEKDYAETGDEHEAH